MSTDEENVEQVIAITGAPRDLALKYIKRYHTADQAVNAWFDTEGILPPETAVSWDESQFHSDKTEVFGPMNKPTSGAFDIHTSDSLNPDVFSNNPSRPPSRMSNYANSTAKNNEDADLQEAMSRSLHQDAGQESGVTAADYGNFRKVGDNETHNSNQWALALPTTSQERIFREASPSSRQREEGVPAMIRPGSSTDGDLGPLLTILHNIPMAKEALLARGHVRNDYGQNADWWKGFQIVLPKVVVLDDPTTHHNNNEDLIHEAQRLMASLEITERAYLSPDALYQASREVKQDDYGSSTTAEFLKKWQHVSTQVTPENPMNDIFMTEAARENDATEGDPLERTQIWEVGVDITDPDRSFSPTLYEQLDDLLWASDSQYGKLKRIYMAPGEVLVFKCQSQSWEEPGINIDIPATLYADRYLEKNIEYVKDMRKERRAVQDKIEQAYKQFKQMKGITNPKNQSFVEATKLLSFAADYLAETPDKSGTVPPKEDTLVDVDSEKRTFQYGDMAAQLQELVGRVTEKVKTFESTKAAAIADFHELSALFKAPVDDPILNPKHKYTLRGVSTDPSTTYVLANPSSPSDLLSADPSDWQWWKMSYVADAPAPLSYQRVTETDVLLAAKHDSRRVLLVYASEAAVNYKTSELPSSLRNFVRADNLLFNQEAEHLSLGSNDAQVDESDFLSREQDTNAGWGAAHGLKYWDLGGAGWAGDDRNAGWAGEGTGTASWQPTGLGDAEWYGTDTNTANVSGNDDPPPYDDLPESLPPPVPQRQGPLAPSENEKVRRRYSVSVEAGADGSGMLGNVPDSTGGAKEDTKDLKADAEENK